MSRVKQTYQDVALICPVSTPYVKQSPHQANWFIGRALSSLLKNSGLKKQQIDGLSVSSFTLAPDTTVSLVEQFGLQCRWLEQITTGGASGVIALQRAARAIQAGDAEVIACIGGDTANASSFDNTISDFSNYSNLAVYPYGSAGPNAPFSLITQYYMDQYGATREDFGRIAVSQRYNANHTTDSLFENKPLDLDSYLNARQIAGPLHLYDCVMPCAGADGFLVTTVERAKQLAVPYVEIAAIEERHNTFAKDPVQLRAGWHQFANDLFNAANVSHSDIDCLQTYDDYPVIVMLQMEGLDFCKPGAAPEFVRNTALTFDGNGLPHNTNGGQLSMGQAGCGFLGVVETARQLLGQSGKNQVKNAATGLVSGYGMVNYDRGLCTAAAILQRGNKS